MALLARFNKSPFPEIDFKEAMLWAACLFRIVGRDGFTRLEAAKLLGLAGGAKAKSSTKIFSGLRLFSILEVEQVGHQIYYHFSEDGARLAMYALLHDPAVEAAPYTGAAGGRSPGTGTSFGAAA